MFKPRVFIASSGEAVPVALAVQQNLRHDAKVTVWTQDSFTIGRNTVDVLVQNLRQSDFGIFVLAPDDTVTIRGQKLKTARDNVFLELGMFIGRLGKERSFIIKPEGQEMRIPSDILGVVIGEYDGDQLDNPQAALAPVCVQIARIIQEEWEKPSHTVNLLVETALETVCRAMSVPVSPGDASLRAFIFRNEGQDLVCRHFWDPNPSDEEVGRTRFTINEQTAKRVVVVRCFLDNKTRSTQALKIKGNQVKPLTNDFIGAKGKISSRLKYVLAAPILREDRSIWGVVNFDASNDTGRDLLCSNFSKSVIVRLANHLSRVLT